MPLLLVVAVPTGTPLSVKLISLSATAGDRAAVRLTVPPYVPVAAVTASVVAVVLAGLSVTNETDTRLFADHVTDGSLLNAEAKALDAMPEL